MHVISRNYFYVKNTNNSPETITPLLSNRHLSCNQRFANGLQEKPPEPDEGPNDVRGSRFARGAPGAAAPPIVGFDFAESEMRPLARSTPITVT